MDQSADAQHAIALGALRRAREAFVAAQVPMDRPEAWTAAQRTVVAAYADAWSRIAVTGTAVAVAGDVDPWERR